MFQNANYDFIKWRWHAIFLSAFVIAAGIVFGVTKGIPLGIDFSGGTIVVVKFQQPVTDDQVRQALVNAIAGEQVIQAYGDPSENEKQIRIPQVISEGQGSLDQNANAIIAALRKANLPQFEVRSQDLVGPVIGADLQRRGIYATLLSIIGITIYIGLRFRFAFAIGAIAATLHDVLVTFSFLFFFGYDLSLNVIAAILTITGYSVNDTIVIFDRVRENLRKNRKDPLEKIVNESVNQTLSRTIITAGTTFLAVLALYLFGGEVLEGFAFTMLVGIISGTYSTIFIAAAIAIILSGKQAKSRTAGTRKAS
jgi:preprotein translocase subunit SecF